MKVALRGLLIVGALVLLGLPVAAYLSGRDELVLVFAAVCMASLCSFLAYRGAVMIRRRIDEIGGAGVRASQSNDSKR